MRCTVLRFVPWRRKKAKSEKLSDSCVPRMGRAITQRPKISEILQIDLNSWSSIRTWESTRFTARRNKARTTRRCQIQNEDLATREPLCEERITRQLCQRSLLPSKWTASHSDWTTTQVQKATTKADDFLASKINFLKASTKAGFDIVSSFFYARNFLREFLLKADS